MGTENKSATVFIIVWRLTEHRGHLGLMITKQYLLMQNSWWQKRESLHSTALGRVSGRTGGTVRAQDGISYVHSHREDLETKWDWVPRRLAKKRKSNCVMGWTSVTCLCSVASDREGTVAGEWVTDMSRWLLAGSIGNTPQHLHCLRQRGLEFMLSRLFLFRMELWSPESLRQSSIWSPGSLALGPVNF